MTYAEKNRMNREHSVLFAKRLVVDSIWKEANLEGIQVTFPETEIIYDGMTVAGLTLTQTKAINNLKHAWEFIFSTLDSDINLGFVRQINSLVGAEGVVPNAGELRQHDVAIGGTSWRPSISDDVEVNAALAEIAEVKKDTERALTYFSTIARGQWFADGNKRTAQLVANFSLIKDGRGVFAIDVGQRESFSKKLIEFYQSGNAEPFHEWLFENALNGAVSPEYTKKDPGHSR
jgi:Fic family protein